MEMGGMWGGFYRISLWVMRLAYINILWGLFTVLGLVFFGYMPATIAMFTVIRKWIQRDTDIPIFKTFLNTFKKEFVKANLFSLVLIFIGLILYVDLRYTGTVTESPFYPILLGGLFLSGVLYVMLILYIGPVYVQYNLTFWQYIRYAIMIGITNLHYSIMMIVIIMGLYYLFMRIPGLFPFFAASTISLVIMWCANLSFMNLVRKQGKVTNKESYKTNTNPR